MKTPMTKFMLAALISTTPAVNAKMTADIDLGDLHIYGSISNTENRQGH